MKIVVGHRWDGSELPEEQRVLVGIKDCRDSLVITVDAPFFNDPAPPEAAPNCEGLWNHEVVEVFIKGKFDKYIELELGPHGHFLILLCDGYRQCFARKLEPIHYQASIIGTRWVGRMEIPLAFLPPQSDVPDAPFTFNAFAIHSSEFCISFPPQDPKAYPVPDFHKLELFRPLPLSNLAQPSSTVWEVRE